MKLILCNECEQFDLIQNGFCSVCQNHFNPDSNFTYIEDSDILGPTLIVFVVNEIHKHPRKLELFSTRSLSRAETTDDQKRVSRCLFFNPEIFNPNLSSNKVPSWTLKTKTFNREAKKVILITFHQGNSFYLRNLMRIKIC